MHSFSSHFILNRISKNLGKSQGTSVSDHNLLYVTVLYAQTPRFAADVQTRFGWSRNISKGGKSDELRGSTTLVEKRRGGDTLCIYIADVQLDRLLQLNRTIQVGRRRPDLARPSPDSNRRCSRGACYLRRSPSLISFVPR